MRELHSNQKLRSNTQYVRCDTIDTTHSLVKVPDVSVRHKKYCYIVLICITTHPMSHNNQQQLVHLIIQHRVTSAQTSAAVCEGKGTTCVVRQRAKGGGNRGKHLQPVIVTSIHSTNRTTGTRGEHGIEGGVQGVHV